MAWRVSLPVVMAFLVLVRIGSAEHATVSLHSGLPEPGWVKVSHGYVVAFNRLQKTPGRDSIEAFDREGRRVLGLDVLRQLPGVAQVSLGDISLRSDGPVVAGATVRKIAGDIEARLLYFNWEGLLVRSVSLPAEQEINNLELDEDGNVWTLADYSGRANDETTGPLIFVYDRTGRLTNSLLRRSDYPARFEEGSKIGGLVGFGLTGEAVWFWQPIRHRMTVVTREGRVLKRMSIALPKSRMDEAKIHPPEADTIALLPSGQVVAGIVSPWTDVPMGAYSSNRNRFVRSSLSALRLIGVDGSDFVFMSQWQPGAGLVEVVREPLPTVSRSSTRSR